MLIKEFGPVDRTGCLVEVGGTFNDRVRLRRPPDLPRRLITIGMAIIGIFWASAIHAQVIGRQLADGWARDFSAKPQVIIFSSTDINLTGSGIKRERDLIGGRMGYRYSGLRLLVYSNERWFLLPADWIDNPNTSAIILPDNDKVRVEIRATRG